MNTNPIIVVELLDAPVEKVWQAITTKEEMKDWYFDLPAFKAEKGFQFQFIATGPKGEEYMHVCEIKEVIPYKKLSYTWTYDGYKGDSLVMFELTKMEDQTKLRLTHSGVESFPKSNSDFDKSNFEMGWTTLITKLLVKHFL
jgi:uncharacterized protein YndB with AHSA1/START domain